MKNIFENIVELIKSGEPATFAVVINTKGSTPRRVGAKMIILRTERLWAR